MKNHNTDSTLCKNGKERYDTEEETAEALNNFLKDIPDKEKLRLVLDADAMYSPGSLQVCSPNTSPLPQQPWSPFTITENPEIPPPAKKDKSPSSQETSSNI